MKTFLIIFGAWIAAIAVAFFFSWFFNLSNREYRKIKKAMKSTVLILFLFAPLSAHADIVGKTYVGQVGDVAIKLVIEPGDVLAVYSDDREPIYFNWKPIFPPAFFLIKGFGVFQVASDETWIKYLPTPGYIFRLVGRPGDEPQPYIDPAPYFVPGWKK